MYLVAGLKPFKRKDDEDLSFFTAVEKKGKGAKAAKQNVPTESKKKLNHDLDTLKTFMTFKLDVPLSTDQIPGTIEKVC